MTLRRRSGRTRLALAGAALVTLAAGAGLTAAAYTDHATLNLGTGAPGSGIGNPDRFDVAVRDADGTLQDAATPGDAVVLPLASGTLLSELTPVVFDVTVVNREPGIAGDITLTLHDPDPVTDDLFGSLRFTVFLDGSTTPAVADATAQQVADAALRLEDVAPGEERLVSVSVLLVEDSGMDVAGKSTQIGLLADGESR